MKNELQRPIETPAPINPVVQITWFSDDPTKTIVSAQGDWTDIDKTVAITITPEGVAVS